MEHEGMEVAAKAATVQQSDKHKNFAA